jgi:hypothetical protein
MVAPTCPFPANINPLQSNGFLLAIDKLPEISFFCQEATIPDISLPPADMDSPLTLSPIPGEKPSFGDFTVSFLIDEEMKNYRAVYNWIVGMGFPEDRVQYTNFISGRTNEIATNELVAGYSDGILQILNNNNKPIQSIQFIDLFPTNLQSLVLQSTLSDNQYLVATVSFRYTLFKFI